MVHPPSSTQEYNEVWRQVSAKYGWGPASMPCVDGRISRATVGGGGGAAVARDGREGGVGTGKWGGDGRNRSSRIGGARWWQVQSMK